MSSDVPTFYLDSCVLLAWIKEEEGRVRDVQALLHDAARGDVGLVASVLSITEVAKGATDAGEYGMESRSRIDKLWLPGSPISVIEFHRLTAEAARDLLRVSHDTSTALKPLDAIHLATAVRHGVEALYTYDNTLMAWSSHVGLKIEAPPEALVLDVNG